MHVVIVGAGISGCALAILLKDQGIDVTLLERHTEQPQTILGTPFLHPYGVWWLKQFIPTSVWNNLVSVGLLMPVSTLNINFPNGTLTSKGVSVNGETNYLCPARPIIDNLFWTLACNHLGEDFRTGVSVTDVIVKERRTVGVVTLSGEEIAADLVVLASGRGAWSILRDSAQLNGAVEFNESRDCIIANGTEFWDLRNQPIVWEIDEGDMSFFFPTSKHTACIVYASPDGASSLKRKAQLRSQFEKLESLSHLKPQLASMEFLHKPIYLSKQTHRLFYLRAGGEGWAALGDAAMHTSPAFGLGIQTALESAWMLSRLIGQFNTDVGHYYAEWHRERFRRMFDYTSGIEMNPYFWSKSARELWVQKRISQFPRAGRVFLGVMNNTIRLERYPFYLVPALLGLPIPLPQTALGFAAF